MLTALGRFLRKIRIDRNELLKDMADKLEVSASFLSAVENGKKSMPSEWNSRLPELYNFSTDQLLDFTEAVAESEKSLDLVFSEVNSNGRQVAVAFARKLPYLTEEQLAAVKNAIEGSD